MAADECSTETAVIGVLGAYTAVTLLVGLLTVLVSDSPPARGAPGAPQPIVHLLSCSWQRSDVSSRELRPAGFHAGGVALRVGRLLQSTARRADPPRRRGRGGERAWPKRYV